MNLIVNKTLVLFFAVLAIFIFDFIISIHAFPLTEGWWEAFAYASKDKVFYQQIYIGLPPLFIDILSLLSNFTDSFLSIRILFILIHIIEFLLISHFFSKFFGFYISVSASLISELLISTYIGTYLPKDYHMILGLLVAIYINLYYYLVEEFKSKNAILIGIITGLIILTKQNVGAMLLASMIFMIVVCRQTAYVRLRILIMYIIGIALTLTLYSELKGYDWINVYLNNNSKGSAFIFLTRILVERGAILTFAFILIFYTFNYFTENINNKYTKLIKKYFELYRNYILAIIFLLIALKLVNNTFLFLAIAITATLVSINLFQELGIKYSRQNLTNFKLSSVPILALLYCNSMTAGFSYVGAQHVVAIFIAIALSLAYKINSKLIFALAFTLLFILFSQFYKMKINGDMYSWWGYSIGSRAANNVNYNNNKISGIKLSEETKDIFLAVENLVRENADSKNYLFYPNIPLFYYLFNLPVNTKFPVLWFDTIPTKLYYEVVEDFIKLNPNYVVWMKPHKEVYAGHAKLRGAESVLGTIDNLLLEGILNGKYSIDYVRPLSLGSYTGKDDFSRITVSFDCRWCNTEEIARDIKLEKIIAASRSDENSKSNFMTVTFPNQYYYLEFCKKYRPFILDQKGPVFLILKREVK